MSRCDDFIDRLYDEDARRALQAGRHPPTDMRPHAAECSSCGSLWTESRGESEWLLGALAEEPSVELDQRALAAMREALPTRPEPLIDWTAPTLWALCGAALAGCLVLLAGPALPNGWPPLLVFGLAAASFAAELTLQGLDATTA